MKKFLWIFMLLLTAVVILSFSPPAGEVPPAMVFIQGGTFVMGTDDDHSDEQPIHPVTLDSFYMGKFEVTQEEFQAVMGFNPSFFKGDNNPVEEINWYDAVEYCNKRSEKEGLSPCYTGIADNIACNFQADGYRLPTEAEWEYACRGGRLSGNYLYSGSNNAAEVAWFEVNSGGKPHPVGEKKPNELGIYDMSGNIWEWCWDWYDENYYKKSPIKNPRGPQRPPGDRQRSYRGGGGCGPMEYMRSSGRYRLHPSYKHSDMGFRVVRKVTQTGKIPAGLVLVDGGTFQMGSNDGAQGTAPAHQVRVNNFYMGKFEVTQEEWTTVMGVNISSITAAQNPVDCVRWYEAVEYCNKRSKMEGLTPCYSGSGDNITCDFNANGYRLPTEAEWEYACRGGLESKNYQYSGSDNAEEVAWYNKNAWYNQTRAVGLKKPNEPGIYDMTGNVWEWCWDRYDKYYYKNSPPGNPQGPVIGYRRIVRGGNIKNPALPCITRGGVKPQNGFWGFGFRVVRTAAHHRQ